MLGRRHYMVAILIGASLAMASLCAMTVVAASLEFDPGAHFSAPNSNHLTLEVDPIIPLSKRGGRIGLEHNRPASARENDGAIEELNRALDPDTSVSSSPASGELTIVPSPPSNAPQRTLGSGTEPASR